MCIRDRYQCNKNNLKHFTYDAVEEVIKFSTRICGDKYKLSTQFNKIMEIIIEGDVLSLIHISRTKKCKKK